MQLLVNCALMTKQKGVADEGYNFKKGFSRSKVYGRIETSPTAKQPKYDKEMRDERMKSIEELQDITRLMEFKEKGLAQVEALEATNCVSKLLS